MTEKKPRIRMTFIWVGFIAVVYVCTYGYAWLVEYQRHQELFPRLALNTLYKELLAHYEKTGSFPRTLSQMDSRAVSRKRPQFDQVNGDMFLNHYQYIYRPTNAPYQCWIWAIPIDERKDEASSRFMILTPTKAWHWKGGALTPEEIKNARRLNDLDDLSGLGMIGQEPLDFKPKKRRR